MVKLGLLPYILVCNIFCIGKIQLWHMDKLHDNTTSFDNLGNKMAAKFDPRRKYTRFGNSSQGKQAPCLGEASQRWFRGFIDEVIARNLTWSSTVLGTLGIHPHLLCQIFHPQPTCISAFINHSERHAEVRMIMWKLDLGYK